MFGLLGVSGMSGIGKTTLARALCERISHHYDSCCFIDNVSEVFQKAGALGVQKELLCQSLNEKNLQIYNVMEGTLLASTRLCNAKRLIVFDNVTQDEQLNMFSGNRETLLRESLGGGSRVLIISRDRQILRTQTVDDVYEVEPLNVKDAIQLFCRKAFKCNYIFSDYEELTHGILSYLQGHPLAIEVTGSSLFSKSVAQWRSTFEKLKNKESENIMHKLRISFDELDATNKEIFLDIACIFHGKYHEEYVKEILDIRGFYPELGLPVLVDKSLITIQNGFVDMPKLLRDLGKYIVTEKSPKEPRKWSRLWDYKDLHKVLSENMDETNIEAIVITYVPREFHKARMTVNALSKLRNLKLLQFPNNLNSSGSISDLSNELGYFEWYNYPCHCLPQSFQPHKLVKLILKRSNIKQLWEDTKPLHNLKYLDLSYSEKLVKLQNFGDAINLEILRLRGCIKLKQIDPTSSFTTNLTTLDMEECISLINLPHFRDDLNLKILNLKGCTKLRQIDPSIGLLKKLTFLNLEECRSLVSIPNNILELNSLEYLSLYGCSQLYKYRLLEEPRDAKHSKKLCIREAFSHSQSSSSIISKFISWLLTLYSRQQKDSVRRLMPSLPIFSSMSHLDLSFCNLLKVPDGIGNLYSLERLILMGNNFVVLPNLKELSKLIHLNIQHGKRLQYLPELPLQTAVPSLMFWNRPENDKVGSGLNIFNCSELGKREHESNKCLAWVMQIVKAFYQYNHYPFNITWGWPPTITSIIAGSEILGWFNIEHVCTNNSIRIDKSQVMDDNDCLGVACCAVFALRINRMDPPKTKPYFCRSIPLFFRSDLVTDESDHLWLFYFQQSVFVYDWDGDKDFMLEIVGGEGYGIEVKKYGYRLLYKKDLQLPNSTMTHTQTSLPQKCKRFMEIEESE